MNNLKIILTVGIAAVLTLSCSTDDGGDGSSSSNNGNLSSSSGGVNGSSSSNGGNNSGGTVYALTEKTDSLFTYVEADTYYDCQDGGVLVPEDDSHEYTVYYSINNNTMIWKSEDSYDDNDTLHLNGASNDLIGTWARTKNKASSCGLRTYCDDWNDDHTVCNEYDEWTSYTCKEDYDITKAVFTDKTVKITRDECLTDYWQDGSNLEETDWKMRVIDCNTIEVYKGSEKVTWEMTKNNTKISYNGNTCETSNPSESQMQAACKDAWDKHHSTDAHWHHYYDDILDESYKAYNYCLKNTLPAELYGDDGEGEDYGGEGYGKIAAKPAAKAKAKAKFKQLFKR